MYMYSMYGHIVFEVIALCFNVCAVGNVSREHVFYLTFPKEVVTDDIKNLFSPFGKFIHVCT